MNNKQEAIDIIAQHQCGHSHLPCCNCIHIAQTVYGRIVPLMRGEFPKDKFENIIWNAHLRGQCWTTYGHGNLNLRIGDLLEEAKCLWEGDHIVEVNKKVCDNIPEQQSKGRLVVASTLRPCPKCGGSGKKLIHTGRPETLITEDDCPDCKGAGECQHKNRSHNRINRYNIKWFWCEDCKQAIYTERSGKERRHASKGRRKYAGGDWADHLLGLRLDRRTLKDRRR